METLFELTAYLGPTLAAILTVPAYEWLQHLIGLLDRAPAPVKQIGAVVVAFGITKMGEAINTSLPTDILLFTGEDLEALLSGGIAMAIHAGRKAKNIRPPPNAAKVFALLFLAFLPASIACQTGRGTVVVVDRNRLEVLVEPESYTGEVGDTVTFIATAVDTITGDTIPAQISWTSLDPAGVSIDATTGEATLLQAGTYEVEAEVLEIMSLIFLTQDDDGTWMEVYSRNRHVLYAARGYMPPEWTMEVGQERPLCTYLETEESIENVPAELSSSDTTIVQVTGNGAGPLCPSWDGATATMSPAELIPLLLQASSTRPG